MPFHSHPGSTLPAIALTLAFASAIPAQTHVPLPDPIPQLIPASPIRVGLQDLASGFVSPTWGTFAPSDNEHLYILDQPGQLYEIDIRQNGRDSGRHGDRDRDNAASMRLILDVSDKLVHVGLFPPLNYDERGFLGLAFHPRFRDNGLLYTFTSEIVNGAADFTTLPFGAVPNAQTVIREWHATNYGDHEEGLVIDSSSSRELMRIDKPQFNHNGGTLVFGPDGLLYISIGDGGGANDVGPGHDAGGNAQSFAVGNVLGKILRIDPLGNNSANGKYGIPRDNPLSLMSGGAPEIWAWGFRNPFRMSFDRGTGDLWVGDVGQNNIEEVDMVHKGMNYGWPIKEGTFLFDNTGFVYANSPGSPDGLVDPIAEYDHADGPPPAPDVRVAVIGGHVYRGHELRSFRGRYFFGDYSGQIGTSANGHLFVLNGHSIENVQAAGRDSLGVAVLGIAEDQEGELYLLSNETGTLNGRTGHVYRITEAEDGRRF